MVLSVYVSKTRKETPVVNEHVTYVFTFVLFEQTANRVFFNSTAWPLSFFLSFFLYSTSFFTLVGGGNQGGLRIKKMYIKNNVNPTATNLRGGRAGPKCMYKYIHTYIAH